MSAHEEKDTLPKFEHQIQFYALLAGFPAVVIGLIALWYISLPFPAFLLFSTSIILCWWGGCNLLKNVIQYKLRTLSNLLDALYEGDYSLKGSAAQQNGALGLITQKINNLGDRLRDQRREEHEDETLLRKVLGEIDAAVFAFDREMRLCMINRKGEQLLEKTECHLLKQSADALNLSDLLLGPSERITELSISGTLGRWRLHRSTFRENGQPYSLILLTDLTKTLRTEERMAWKRLIQVLRHEINNSLTPIRSIAGSLKALQIQIPRPEDWEDDLQQGLGVIEKRSESLQRFIRSYSEIARLPNPQLKDVEVDTWIKRIAKLESRINIQVEEGPQLLIQADSDQLDQLLINLLRNAVDAVINRDGRVIVGWRIENNQLQVWIKDNGPGISDPEQAFTPFYTTKPDGAGIGLPLCRQIAENHNGTLAIASCENEPGCCVMLRIPLSGAETNP